MTIYFVTSNDNKAKEFSEILGIPVTRLNFDGYGIHEVQGQVEDVSRVKCEQVRSIMMRQQKFHDNDLIIVEDSGLQFHALNGFTGAYIKEFEQALGNRGIYEMVSKLDTQGATAICVFSIVGYDHGVSVFEGIVEGTIVEPQGEYGFSWDKIFRPNTMTEGSYGTITSEEKNKNSPRKIALEKLRNWLTNCGQYHFASHCYKGCKCVYN